MAKKDPIDELQNILLGMSSSRDAVNEDAVPTVQPKVKSTLEQRLKRLQVEIKKDRDLAQEDRKKAEEDRKFVNRIADDVKDTSGLVRFGFIVIITTTAATVISSIAILLTSIFALYQFWSDKENDVLSSGPTNSCAIIERADY